MIDVYLCAGRVVGRVMWWMWSCGGQGHVVDVVVWWAWPCGERGPMIGLVSWWGYVVVSATLVTCVHHVFCFFSCSVTQRRIEDRGEKLLSRFIA